jgi:hypothetical protein
MAVRNRLEYSIFLVLLFVIMFYLPATASYAQEATEDETTNVTIPDAWAPAMERVPESDRDAVAQALELAGTNATVLVNVLVQCPEQWMPGALFLIVNSPVEDLTVVTEELFLNNLRYSYEAYMTFPWAKTVAFEDFLEYVLPMRVSQEPLEDWRGFFYDDLKPRVENLATLEEAAIEANRWASERVRFVQTQRRDQGPFETLTSGYGRCEEMMIVYIDACRAIGVPARQAWTPYWPFMDNNHAWTEVLGDDGNWHYTESCSVIQSLDSTWFSDPTKRASLIFSVPFGFPDPETSDIYRMNEVPGSIYAVINSVSYYRDTTRLKIDVVDISGNPMPETNVYLSVFNFGALRPIARGVTDENGHWEITVGPGGFFISAGNEASGACMSIQIEQMDELALTLHLGLGAEIPPETMWLRYPYPAEEVSE